MIPFVLLNTQNFNSCANTYLMLTPHYTLFKVIFRVLKYSPYILNADVLQTCTKYALLRNYVINVKNDFYKSLHLKNSKIRYI